MPVFEKPLTTSTLRAAYALVLLVLSVLTSPVAAHTRSQSFSNWSFEENIVEFTFAVDARRITQLASLHKDEKNLASLLQVHLLETLHVNQTNSPCRLKSINPVGEGHARIHISGQFECTGPVKDGNTEVTVAAFFRVSPTHIHIAQLQSQDNLHEMSLWEGYETFTLAHTQSVTTLRGFMSVGFSHVLSGLDHVLFLIGLALAARNLGLAMLCILGFTLGHSATLALALMGLVRPDTNMIEVLIGYTIAIMALEAASGYGLDRRRALTGFALLTVVLFAFQLPVSTIVGPGLALAVFAFASGRMSQKRMLTFLPIMTILFGLIHGAGFARGLSDANLVRNELFQPLLGFNLGVELAQIVILVVAYSAIKALDWLKVRQSQMILQTACLVIFTAGCFWFTQRLIYS